MYKIITTLFAVFTLTVGFSQEKSNPIVEATFKVDGVCGMCKSRIEEAALRTKGVKKADWNKKTKLLTVTYNSQKVGLKDIHTAVASKGHTAADIKADSTVYSKLPDCCKYKEGAVCHD